MHFFPEEGPTNNTLKRVCSSIQNIKGKPRLREALVDLLIPVNPSKSLLEISKIRWKAIYTVNVDDAIERAYENESEKSRSFFQLYLSMIIQQKTHFVK